MGVGGSAMGGVGRGVGKPVGPAFQKMYGLGNNFSFFFPFFSRGDSSSKNR